MFNLGIYVRVKFRALFMDFGIIEKAWTVGISTNQPLSILEVSVNQVPSSARKIHDNRGVLVKVW